VLSAGEVIFAHHPDLEGYGALVPNRCGNRLTCCWAAFYRRRISSAITRQGSVVDGFRFDRESVQPRSAWS